MNRDNNTLKQLYGNVLCGENPVNAVTQRRIHQFAKRTKDADLAAGLARRSDTIDELDDELAGWAVAKVQAAWFARPGRNSSDVAKRLEREKRITVLEAGAVICDLDQDVYRSFAAKDSVRIAIQLLKNPSVAPATKETAAATLGRSYSNASYTKRYEIQTELNKNGAEVTGAFIETRTDIAELKSLIGNLDSCSARGISHVYRCCIDALATIPALQAEYRSTRNKNGWWRPPHVEVASNVSDILRQLVNWPLSDDGERSELRQKLEQLLTTANSKEDRDFVEELKTALYLAGGENGDLGGRVNQARNASGIKEIKHLLKSWTAGDEELDDVLAGHLLCNEHMTAEFVPTVIEAMRWNYHGIVRSIVANNRTLRLDILGAVMVATNCTSDTDIENYRGSHDASTLWATIVKSQARTEGFVPEYTLSSKFANVDVLADLPLSILTQRDIPAWMSDSIATYLERSLTSDKAWDCFEVLAPRHLGTIEQLVKAANNATRRR